MATNRLDFDDNNRGSLRSLLTLNSIRESNAVNEKALEELFAGNDRDITALAQQTRQTLTEELSDYQYVGIQPKPGFVIKTHTVAKTEKYPASMKVFVIRQRLLFQCKFPKMKFRNQSRERNLLTLYLWLLAR